MAKQWYVLHTYSGQEQKAVEAMKKRLQAYNMIDRLGNIIIPMQQVVETKSGKKVISEKKLFPGYIIIEIEMDEKVWQIIRSTPGISGFISAEKKPIPLTDAELANIMNKIEEVQEKATSQLTLEKGEKVRIIDGPFYNFVGEIEEINPVKNTIKVMVTIFGRATPIELSFHQVEKAS